MGGSSGSAFAGALRYLRSPAGRHIAEDPRANVIVLFPDGVRNYMSKPWFLTENSAQEGQELRTKIKDVIGRDLGDVHGGKAAINVNSH